MVINQQLLLSTVGPKPPLPQWAFVDRMLSHGQLLGSIYQHRQDPLIEDLPFMAGYNLGYRRLPKRVQFFLRTRKFSCLYPNRSKLISCSRYLYECTCSIHELPRLKFIFATSFVMILALLALTLMSCKLLLPVNTASFVPQQGSMSPVLYRRQIGGGLVFHRWC